MNHDHNGGRPTAARERWRSLSFVVLALSALRQTTSLTRRRRGTTTGRQQPEESNLEAPTAIPRSVRTTTRSRSRSRAGSYASSYGSSNSSSQMSTARPVSPAIAHLIGNSTSAATHPMLLPDAPEDHEYRAWQEARAAHAWVDAALSALGADTGAHVAVFSVDASLQLHEPTPSTPSTLSSWTLLDAVAGVAAAAAAGRVPFDTSHVNEDPVIRLQALVDAFLDPDGQWITTTEIRGLPPLPIAIAALRQCRRQCMLICDPPPQYSAN